MSDSFRASPWRNSAQYKDKSISKLGIFHYVYALLHPTYRTTYAANLKRELPRLPFVATHEAFRPFVQAGERLADLHVNYEAQTGYKLEHVENTEADLDWGVERMRLSKDKQSSITTFSPSKASRPKPSNIVSTIPPRSNGLLTSTKFPLTSAAASPTIRTATMMLTILLNLSAR